MTSPNTSATDPGEHEHGIAAPGFRLPAATRIGTVRLQISDLARSIAYYERVLGLQRKRYSAELDASAARARLSESQAARERARGADSRFTAALSSVYRDPEEARKLLHGRADILALQNIPLTWRNRTNPLSHLASVENQNPAFQLPLFESFEATLRQVNAKRRRKKFRIQSRRAEEMGGYSHVIARSPQEKCELLQAFFRLKAKGIGHRV